MVKKVLTFRCFIGFYCFFKFPVHELLNFVFLNNYNLKLDKENIQLLINKSQLQIKAKREQLKLLDKKVYKKNKFQFYPEEHPWIPVYIDLEKYNETKEIYATYFSHIYQDLLSECCDALKMPYLFSFVPDKEVIDDSLFIKDTSSRVKNKNGIIRKSAYLLHLVKTFEENDYDIFCPKSVHALFAYDDINTVEIVRNVLISFLIRSSDEGISKSLEIFKKNTKGALKMKKTIEKKKSIKSQVPIPENYEEIKNKISDEKLLSRKEASDLLKISLPTLNAWTKKQKIISYGIEGRVYYKKEELLDSLEKLKK